MNSSEPAGALEGMHEVVLSLPMFGNLTPAERSLVEQSLVLETYAFGTVLVREHEPGDALYIVLSGTARVVKTDRAGREVTVNTLSAGDVFGELALLEQAPRSATVRASSEVRVLRLDRAVFDRIAREHPNVRAELELQVRHYRVRDLLRVHSVFSRLSAPALARLIAALREITVGAGDVLVREGDPPGSMYIVRSGRLRGYQLAAGSQVNVSFLRVGDIFGEASLFAQAPRRATIEALTDCELFELEPEHFERLLADDPQLRELIGEAASTLGYEQRARVPLDFALELLPSAADHQQVGPEQVGERGQPASDQSVLPDMPPVFSRPVVPIRKFPHTWQIDAADCGAACVAMVCRYLGREISLARVREAVQTGTDGTSLLGIARGGEALGLAVKTVKVSPANLDEMALPAIAHWNGNHWVVVYDTDGEWIRVSDPAIGRVRVPRAEFLEKWSGYAAFFARTDALDEQPEEISRIGWFAEFFAPHRRRLGIAILIGLCAAGAQMIVPVLGQVVVDQVVGRRDHGLLPVLVLAMLGAVGIAFAATVAQRYLLSYVTVRIDSASLDFLTRKLFSLSMDYFNKRRIGDIERRLDGMRLVRQFVVQFGVQGLTATLQIAVALVLMFVYSPLLAIVYCAAAPLYAALVAYSTRRLKPTYNSLEESFGKYQSRQIDSIKGIETVKAMNAEEELRGLLLSQFSDLIDRLFRADLTVMLYEGAVQLVTFLSLVTFLAVGALLVEHHHLTLGGLVAFNALVVLANAPIVVVMGVWDQLQYVTVLLARLNDVIEQEPEQAAAPGALRAVPSLGGRITLRNVSFSYGGAASPPILDSISLDVAPGTNVAIVGRSGSGKTTLIKCLAGLLEPTAGSISYDGVDARTLDHRQLRRQIGFVLQENHIFDDTIARNIAFGEGLLDMERIRWAARVAAADGFISRLPLGYDTPIGESGLRLSGGQNQRIAIARAVFRRPAVLIFDEATSSLDTESEREVQANMGALLDGRTSFVIAHRLSTVRDADVIVVLERGRLVECGTHEELMAGEGLYYYLVSQQLAF